MDATDQPGQFGEIPCHRRSIIDIQVLGIKKELHLRIIHSIQKIVNLLYAPIDFKMGFNAQVRGFSLNLLI